MRIIYIAGLEHSGTTLTDHLLSSRPGVLGLGEVSSFFSPRHMRQYMDRWGDYPVASLCSCGSSWQECDFWGGVFDLCGLNSEESMIDKYQKLLMYVRERHGDDAMIIDSSKSLAGLEHAVKACANIGLSPCDVSVIYTVKDVRSFSASMLHKSGASKSMLAVFRSFNYWLGANKQFIEYFQAQNMGIQVNLYEALCADPSGFLDRALGSPGGAVSFGAPDISVSTSHIAMGNKDFLLRNRKHIEYDARWKKESRIKAMYLAHHNARSLNKFIQSLQRAQ